MRDLFKNWPEDCKRAFREFPFTSNTGELNDIDNKKLDFHFVMEELINKNLSIKNYTSTIKDIIFGYILIDRSKINMPNHDYISRLLPKTKTIDVGLNLNFEEFTKANEDEAKQIMIDKYLWCIQNLLSKRKDFDHKRFYDDNVKLFAEYVSHQ